ncbi:alpha/beta hydrolase [Mucilaginibacter aquaedulcis]|uniref:alpha/beta hydrolase n=1 Tax=Mucilaginibacter aquaedulcis TaxID=1187081 RepID=UPI0025B61F0F|nr:alpha/beta hydrolase [Mucilaginibacter aquaedulcis]MDN3550670.1 alpha/beta hydrolase [Mucilaginibacter aquaedulcis]
MKTQSLKNRLKAGLAASAIILSTIIGSTVKVEAQAPVKNIVLVHGAFADGSGFKGLYDILTKKGYNVSVVQNPLTSLKDDVDAANRTIDKQDGPVILVGHSWGGTVITEAGNNPKVVALVYVAAFAPDNGETTLKLVQSLPAAPENGILPPDDKGFVYFSKEKFHAGFAADLSKEEADFMYASQGPIAAQGFVAPITQAAWKTKPSYAVVATEDKAINPDIERNMYKRAGSKVTEIKSSHVVFISHPDAVAKVIIEAATKAGETK